jgi:hypothetical protein
VTILVVGGSTKDIGKTSLVCAIITAFRDFDWTAVKISAHDYIADTLDHAVSSPTIREETTAGGETDTSRYLAAGARRALLVTRHDDRIPVEEIRRALGGDRNVIYESNRIVDVVKPDLCLALMAEDVKTKASFERLLRVADAVVSAGGGVAEMPMESRRFRLKSADQLSPEMMNWLRERLRI